MTERDLIFLCCGSITASIIFAATNILCDFFYARKSTDARIKRSLRAAERRVIRAVILGGAVK